MSILKLFYSAPSGDKVQKIPLEDWYLAAILAVACVDLASLTSTMQLKNQNDLIYLGQTKYSI